MAIYTSPLQTDAEFQWDPDSTQKSVNCGPSAVEKVANFFKNLSTYGIERTRRLGSSRVGTGTNLSEQKKMLEARGIPSSAQSLGLSEIKDRLKSGRRPIVLWLVMSEIPSNIRRHTFLGTHAVAGLANGIVNGVSGIWIMDPNFRRERDISPHKIFVPDRYIAAASKRIGGWCLVPDKEKVIPTRTPLKQRFSVTTPVLNIRSAPTAASTDVGNLTKGATFTSNLIETAGGSYKVGTVTRRDWIGYVKDGKQRWAAKGYLKEA